MDLGKNKIGRGKTDFIGPYLHCQFSEHLMDLHFGPAIPYIPAILYLSDHLNVPFFPSRQEFTTLWKWYEGISNVQGGYNRAESARQVQETTRPAGWDQMKHLLNSNKVKPPGWAARALFHTSKNMAHVWEAKENQQFKKVLTISTNLHVNSLEFTTTDPKIQSWPSIF